MHDVNYSNVKFCYTSQKSALPARLLRGLIRRISNLHAWLPAGPIHLYCRNMVRTIGKLRKLKNDYRKRIIRISKIAGDLNALGSLMLFIEYELHFSCVQNVDDSGKPRP